MYTARQVQELVNTISIWASETHRYRVGVNTDRFVTTTPTDSPPRILLVVSDDEGHRTERVVSLQNYRQTLPMVLRGALDSMVQELEGDAND